MRNNSIPLLLGAFFLLFVSCQSKQDKTENVKDQDSVKVTISDVESGIRANIETRIQEGEGYFTFQNDTLDLSL